MTDNLRSLLTITFAVLIVACSSGPPPAADAVTLTKYQRQVRAESLALATETDTTYKRRMLDLIRRSHLVQTDSLARLYAALPRTPKAEWWRLRQALGCEGGRLTNKYGLMPYARADDRVRDSLQRSGVDLEKIGDGWLASPGPPMEISFQVCGESMFRLPHVPDSLSEQPNRTPRLP